MTYELSGPAVQDLREIHDWIAADDPTAAARVMLDIRDALRRLAEAPGLGHPRDDLADVSLRAWTVHRYVIVYLADSSPLTVVRVVSGLRDFGSLFG